MNRKKGTKINIWKNGATARFHNKEINFVEIPEKQSIMIQFKFADENAHNPSVKHSCLKGKVRVSEIALSHEAMNALLYSYSNYINKSKNIQP